MTRPGFPPREGDLRRADLLASAEAAADLHGPSAHVSVHFKFTCEACGERCTLQEPGVLYESGECCECGHVTEIRSGGFVLVLGLRPAGPGRGPRGLGGPGVC